MWPKTDRIDVDSSVVSAVNRHGNAAPNRPRKGPLGGRFVPVVHRGDPRDTECPSRS